MTRFAQSNAERSIKEAVLSASAFDKLIPQFSEFDYVMVGMKIDLMAYLAACSTLLAGVIVAFVYVLTPSNVWFGVAQYQLLQGLSMYVTGSLFTYSALGSLNIGDQPLVRSHVVERQVFGDANCGAVHIRFDDNRFAAVALTFVLALISLHPLVNAFVIGFAVVTGIRAVLNVPSHIVQSLYQIQRSAASKQGELLETPPGHAEGNQQPSREYTRGRFRDYRSSEVCLITG